MGTAPSAAAIEENCDVVDALMMSLLCERAQRSSNAVASGAKTTSMPRARMLDEKLAPKAASSVARYVFAVAFACSHERVAS